MTKILALTLGGVEVPSSNFRLRCYYSFFERESITVTEINLRQLSHPKLPNIPKIRGIVNMLGLRNFFLEKNKKFFRQELKKAEIIWVNKVLKPEFLPIVKQYNKPIVLDIDDAIWIGAEEIVQQNLDIANTVVVGNEYLKSEIKKRFSGNIVVIPTTVNVNDYPSKPNNNLKNSFKIGWLGSSYTNEYLEEIAPAINQFLSDHEDVYFEIISSDFDRLKKIFPKQTLFTEWTMNSYISKVADFSVGIMPMPNNEWVKGKCSFKMLQYMATFVPVIVSPYGMNAEVLESSRCGVGATSHQEWISALENLYSNRELREQWGIMGRKIIEQQYSTQANFELLKSLFLSIK